VLLLGAPAPFFKPPFPTCNFARLELWVPFKLPMPGRFDNASSAVYKSEVPEILKGFHVIC